jgi:hypothetical protein
LKVNYQYFITKSGKWSDNLLLLIHSIYEVTIKGCDVFLYVINANVGHSDDNSVFDIVIVIDIRAKKGGGGTRKSEFIEDRKTVYLNVF